MTHDKAVQQQRDKKLVQYTASLDRMAELVDFAAVAAAVDGACPRPDRSSKGGRPPYPTLVMVRVLFLQALYNLSDEECEHQLLDRRSFQRFCGLADELSVPDARTVWLFRQRLTAGGLGARAIFEAMQQQLQAHGYLPRGGQIVDATIVKAPIQQLEKDEKAQLDEGKVPKDWRLKKVRHKDIQARWTKKHSRSFFGYKLHANVDVRWKLIRRWKVTPANVDDGQTLPEVLDRANTERASTLTAATTTRPTAGCWRATAGVTASRARPELGASSARGRAPATRPSTAGVPVSSMSSRNCITSAARRCAR